MTFRAQRDRQWQRQLEQTGQLWSGVYVRCPDLLVGELAYVFHQPKTAEEVVIHNYIMQRILVACPAREVLLRNVARAIIDTITGTSFQGVTTDGEANEPHP
ncbi:MAG: hypothetical protein V2A79_10110 [Planctomycetota bacterium]